MRPSRRVLLLSAVAIACGAVIVGAALIALETPEHAVARVESRTLPAIVALDDARARSIEGQQLFFEALASPPDQRNAIIADAQQTGARATTAWHQYQRIAYGSHQELSLQRQFEAGTKAGQVAGAAVFTVVNAPESPAYDIALAQVRAVGSQIISTLDTIEHRFYERRLRGDLLKIRDGLEATRRALLITFFAVLFLGVLNAAFLLVGALREERLLSLRDEERIDGQRRTDLETQLQRGLEMEPTERDTYGVVRAALALAQPNSQIELLLADSSRSHFRQVVTTGSPGAPECPVPSPLECPAAIGGQTRLFSSGTRLDACPFLRDRDDPRKSAACVPVSIAGSTTGVVHMTGADHELPSLGEMTDVELVARKVGDRIGFLRVLARSESHARVDVLTGLINRRSIDEQANAILERGDELVVAYADLDFFKQLNDKYGHETGDRTLRIFGRVLRDSVRPTDVPGRYGGEEFVILFPNCALSDAKVVVQRIRQRLAFATEIGTVPQPTVSIGLASSRPPETFEETLARADAALLEAKAAGRDRVVLASSSPLSGDQEIPDEVAKGARHEVPAGVLPVSAPAPNGGH